MSLHWADSVTVATDRDSSVVLVRERGIFPRAEVEWLSEARDGRPSLGRSQGGYAYLFPDIAAFLLPPDGSVRIFPDAGADPLAVEFVLFRGVLPRLLHLRRIPCLHAGAVQVGENVVGFIGDSGAGKSTVAAGLTMLGMPFVTDDVLPVRLGTDGTVLVGPGLQELRLHEFAAAKVGITRDLVLPKPGSVKGRWIPSSEQTAHVRAPLASVYLLSPNGLRPMSASVIRVGTRLRPMSALRALIEHSFWMHAQETRMLASDLEVLGAIARSVPVRRLTYELSPTGLAAVQRLLLRTGKATKQVRRVNPNPIYERRS